MTKKLRWDEIRSKYDHEWVHLIDYEWDEGTPYPLSGVVHLHAKTRKEFNSLMKTSDPIPGARIYVGKIKNEEDSLRTGCLVVNQHANS